MFKFFVAGTYSQVVTHLMLLSSRYGDITLFERRSTMLSTDTSVTSSYMHPDHANHVKRRKLHNGQSSQQLQQQQQLAAQQEAVAQLQPQQLDQNGAPVPTNNGDFNQNMRYG